MKETENKYFVNIACISKSRQSQNLAAKNPVAEYYLEQ